MQIQLREVGTGNVLHNVPARSVIHALDHILAMKQDVTQLDLRGQNLVGLDGRGGCWLDCDFSYANLQFATLSNCDLSQSVFRYADLRHANLDRATGHDTDFGCANLQFASLDFAQMGYAKFAGADLRNISGNDYQIALADFTEANLANVEIPIGRLTGLNQVQGSLDVLDLTKVWQHFIVSCRLLAGWPKMFEQFWRHVHAKEFRIPIHKQWREAATPVHALVWFTGEVLEKRAGKSVCPHTRRQFFWHLYGFVRTLPPAQQAPLCATIRKRMKLSRTALRLPNSDDWDL